MPSTPEASNNLPEFNLAIWKYKGEKGQLIPLLQKAQDTYGYIPETAINYISEVVGIPSAEIYGVITFYTQFRLRPMGKYVIKVCNGTACHVNGAKSIGDTLQRELAIGYGDTTEDGLFTLQSVACLGCCSLAPVIMINDETHGRLTSRKLRAIIKKYKSGEETA